MAEDPRIMASIADKEDRLVMLQQLADELSAEERHALTLMLARKNGPLAVLPLEVILQIFSYLSILDTWRLQLVSRQWRSVLGSDEVLKASLARWDTHDPSDSARSLETAGDDTVEARGRRMQAMRYGRPCSSAMYHFRYQERRNGPLSQVHRDFALKADHIAFIDNDAEGTHRVVVRNLVKGTVKIFNGTAREAICGIALTTTIVAFLNFNGKLYVHSLADSDSDLREMRLPSASVSAFGADGNLCALSFRADADGTYTIALYDHGKGKLKAFTAACFPLQDDEKQRIISPHTLLLSARHSFIDLFSSLIRRGSEKDDPGEVYFQHARYSLAGELMTSSEYTSICSALDATDGQREGQSDTLHGDMQPTGIKDLFVFRSPDIPYFLEDDGTERARARVAISLFFNSRTAELEERSHVAGIRRKGLKSYVYDSVLWKDTTITCGPCPYDIVLKFNTVHEPPHPQADDPDSESDEDEQQESQFANFRLRGQVGLQDEKDRGYNNRDIDFSDRNDTLFVNDTFVVALGYICVRDGPQNRRIHVFCFDEGLDCSKDFQPYRPASEGDEESNSP